VTTTDNASHTIQDATFSYLSNGFLSGENHWTGTQWITTMTASANSNGTVHQRFNSVGTPTTYSYAATGSGGCNGLLQTGTSTNIGGVTLTTANTWDCNGGKLLSFTDENGNASQYTYDLLFRPSTQTDPITYEVTETYPTATTSTVSDGFFTTTATVDALGRPIRTQKTDGSSYDTISTAYGFTANNNTQFQTSASQPCIVALNADCTKNHFGVIDPLGRTITTSTTSNETATTVYYADATHSVFDVQTTLSPAPSGENAKVVQTEYDGLGRVMSVCKIQTSGGTSCGQAMGGSGIATVFSYSSAPGSTTVTATRGVQTRTTVKDALGRVISQTDPERGTKQYIYDYYAPTACGNPANLPGRLYVVAQASNNDKCFDYDSSGRLTDINENLANNSAFVCTRFRFDSPSKGIFTAPGTITNGAGRIVEAETDDCTVYPPTAGHWFSDEWFSYDAVGNVTDMWESTPHSGGYYHSSAKYFANGKMSSLTLPAVGTVNYTVDPDGRWQSMKVGSLTLVSSVTYGPNGPTQVNVGMGTDKDVYTYDVATGRMKTFQFFVGSANSLNTLNWNTNGSLGSLNIVDGFYSSNSQTCAYIYDDLARLTSDQCGTPWAQTYSYDMYDNMNQFGSQPFTYTYNAANNHYSTSGVTYDADGDLTYDGVNTYTYNASDKLSSAYPTGRSCTTDSTGGCFTYDAFGRVIERQTSSGYTQTLYSPAGKSGGMAGQGLNFAFIPSPGGSFFLTSGAQTFLYNHRDWLGTIRTLSSIPASGNGTIISDRAFSPYGKIYDSNGTNGTQSQIFTGDTHLSIGLFDTPNRELNQSQGRWLSPDPAGASWNAYSYVTNPNSLTDTSGLGADEGAPNPIDGQGMLNNPSAMDDWAGIKYGCAIEGAWCGGPQQQAQNHGFWWNVGHALGFILTNEDVAGERQWLQKNVASIDGIQNKDFGKLTPRQIDNEYARANAAIDEGRYNVMGTPAGSGWTLGSGKSAQKWANQMAQRGWTPDQISEAIQKGEQFPATNNINTANGATRYVNPSTGRSVVLDNVTREVIHVGGDGFQY
jgi:RHS repeat-associated protein